KRDWSSDVCSSDLESGPCWLRSPNPGAFHPPKVWYAIGTGIGTLIPTIPTLTAVAKSRAAPPLDVKMATPLPYSCSVGSFTASSKVSARTGQERTEDFISVNRHVWRHMIEKCWSSKEALGE